MPKIPLEISTGFYQSESLPLCAQRCVNWIPVIPQAKSLNQKALFGSSGIKSFSAASAQTPNRGAILMGSTPYSIDGGSLFSTSSSGVKTAIGSIEGLTRVSMATNGSRLCVVVPGGKGYVYDGATLVEISDPDYITSDTVSFKDGYFVFTASDGSVFFNSSLNDPTEFDPLDFGTAEIKPDKIIGSHVNHNELYILGEKTIELFQNIGGTGFPFQRIQGANIQKGIHAKFSAVEFDSSFCFVGGGDEELSSIWRVTGSSSVIKISTSAIDNAIQEFTEDEIAASFAFSYAERGNFFAVFTFVSSVTPSKTFIYDSTASSLAGFHVWHERQSGVNDNSWRVNSLVKAYGKLLVWDNFDNRIGEIDKDTRTEYGNVIFRSEAGAPFSNGGNSAFQDEIELTMESGIGLTSGQGSDPIIRMDYSDDGGRTFSSEFQRKIGKIGAYGHRSAWRRLGRIPAHRITRFTMSEPVKANILKMESIMESGLE